MMSLAPIVLNSRLRGLPVPVLLHQFKSLAYVQFSRTGTGTGVPTAANGHNATAKDYSSSSSSNPQFKSSLSLDKLYPNSTVNMAKQPKIPEQKDPNKFTGYIPIGIIERLDMNYNTFMEPITVYDGQKEEYARVTAVRLRFHVESADWLPQPIRQNFMKKYQNVISKDGYFTIHSDRTYTRTLNTADAMEKLREMIRSCEPQQRPVEPEPESKEVARRKRLTETREKLHQKGRAQLRASTAKDS